MMMRAVVGVVVALCLGCGGGQSSRLALGPTPPGVIVEARVDYYDVTAASIGELQRGMRALGPRWEGRSFQAAAQSHFRWTFQYDRDGVTCRLRRVKVQVRTVVTFPRWNPTADPDSETLEWWRQLNAGLSEHERGHAQISVKTAGEIAREIEGMSGPRCDALPARAEATATRLIATSRARQAEYDRTTRHGATQIEQAGHLRSP